MFPHQAVWSAVALYFTLDKSGENISIILGEMSSVELCPVLQQV